IDIDRLAAALMLYAQQKRRGGGHQGTAGLDDKLGLPLLAKMVGNGLGDGRKISVHRRRFAGRVGGRISATYIEALEFDTALFNDTCGSGDVALIGISVLALRAHMEAEARRIAHLLDSRDNFGSALFHDAELD